MLYNKSIWKKKSIWVEYKNEVIWVNIYLLGVERKCDYIEKGGIDLMCILSEILTSLAFSI